MIGNLEVEKFVDDDLGAEGCGLAQKACIKGQPASGGTTVPFALEGLDVNFAWFNADAPSPCEDFRVEF